jgi:hypothetical protein
MFLGDPRRKAEKVTRCNNYSYWRYEFSMQSTLDAPVTDTSGKYTHTIAGLIGHIPESQFLQIDNLIETRSQEQLHALWEAAVARRAQLANPSPSSPCVTPLPGALAPYEQEIRQRLTYKRYYEGYRFCLVPVQELITPQWYVNLDYIDLLKQRTPQPGKLREALDFACDEGGVILPEPCNSNFGGLPSLALQGPIHRDLATPFALLQPFEVHRLSPQRFSLDIHAEIELKPNYLHLIKAGTRYIIINGVHRSLALLQAGWQSIPCLVRDASPTIRSLAELGFQQNAGLLPDELILRGIRPAYLSDYLDPVAAPHFQQRNVNALWQVIPQILLNKQAIPQEQ